MADYGSQNVRCPFYREKQDDKYRIKCEGVIKGTTTQLTFRGDKGRYIKEFCCRNFENCRIYRMLESKYDKK